LAYIKDGALVVKQNCIRTVFVRHRIYIRWKEVLGWDCLSTNFFPYD